MIRLILPLVLLGGTALAEDIGFQSGTYALRVDGGTGTLDLSPDRASVAIGGRGCTGGVSGVPRQPAPDRITFTEQSGALSCTIDVALVDGKPKSFSGRRGCSDFSGASCSLVGEVTGREVPVDFGSVDSAFNALPMSLREQVQRELADRGLYRSAIDGAIGPGTRGAIRNAARAASNTGQSVRLDSEEAVRSFLNDLLRLDLSTLPEEPSFFGEWECEGGIFSFRKDGYLIGQTGERLPYLSIEKATQGAYGITFVDGYRLGLFDVTESSMTWSSPASGDTFSCSRVRDVTPPDMEEESPQEQASRETPGREVPVKLPSDNPDKPFVGRWACTSDMFPSATVFEFTEDSVNVPAMGRRTEYADVGPIGERDTAFLINLRDGQQAAIFELEDARMLMTAAGGLFECRRDPA
jgi:hypothetical protein